MSGAVGSAGRVTSALGRSANRPQPSAAQLALALAAAARIMGVAPEAVFDGRQSARRARILAGAALKASTGCVAHTLAAALRLSGPELSPSMVARAGVTTDMMLEVVEAVNGVTPTAAVRPARDGEARPLPAAAGAESPARKAASKPAAVAERREVRPGPAPEARPAASGPASGPTSVSTTGPAARRARRSEAVQRLRPMTAARLRFARWFVQAGWAIEEVADLFDAHPDALADALEFGVAA
ncbi:hypothetical protein [Brevundimonas aurantiaca]|uniref:hypothetical protein n=1 Tax=Brevundimonas aurantiaca TaxID=74316 RepID=UPI0019188793|nr:hypothetical protein [Brevundimonas aurantiaca]